MKDLDRKFTGVHAVLYALFDSQEQLDRAAMRKQVQLAVAAGCKGVTVLGLATEVFKLAASERRMLIDWVAEDIAGQVPLSVTIAGNSVGEQADLARHAQAAGADWLILQPPMQGSYSADELLAFFSRVAETVDLPLAIQHAPAYLGTSLTHASIAKLCDRIANLTHLKAEESAIGVKPLVQATQGRLTVLNGRGGLEMTDCMRAGCSGFILAPDIADCATRIHAQWSAGDQASAEQLYAECLPAITFVMQSIEHLTTYGKRIFGLRAGVEIHDRAPTLRPTEFGKECAARWAKKLGPYGTDSTRQTA